MAKSLKELLSPDRTFVERVEGVEIRLKPPSGLENFKDLLKLYDEYGKLEDTDKREAAIDIGMELARRTVKACVVEKLEDAEVDRLIMISGGIQGRFVSRCMKFCGLHVYVPAAVDQVPLG